MSRGAIANIIKEVEARHTAFAVARLVMITGVDFRSFGDTSEDDEKTLARLRKALPSVLSQAELAELEHKLR